MSRSRFPFMENESLCRICLESAGTISIFDNKEKCDSVFSKLCLSLNEEIKDIEGYPKNICNLCQITLNSVCNFIKKYRESCKIIEKSLYKVKQEIVEIELSSSDGQEYDLPNENVQPKIELDEYFVELLKPNNLTTKIKNETDDIKSELPRKKKKGNNVLCKKNTAKCENKNGKNVYKKKVIYKNRPSAIAQSILEGEFVWNGDLWRTVEEHESTKKIIKQTIRQKPLQNLSVHKKEPPTRLCDLCGKTFTSQDNLKSHQNIVHIRNIKYPCPHCTKVFFSNAAQKRHIKRIHSGKKDFVCPVCGKIFAYERDGKIHYSAVHLKETKYRRRYPCSICKKLFANTKSVLIHERSVHTGERPAVCTVCGSSFFHEDYLKEHMRLHTGATPYKCPVCGRGYAQRGNMKSHIRHNHRLADVDPQLLSTIRPSYLKHFKE